MMLDLSQQQVLGVNTPLCFDDWVVKLLQADQLQEPGKSNLPLDAETLTGHLRLLVSTASVLPVWPSMAGNQWFQFDQPQTERSPGS